MSRLPSSVYLFYFVAVIFLAIIVVPGKCKLLFHRHRQELPRGWGHVRQTSGHEPHSFLLHLSPNNHHIISQLLETRSNPSHSSYAQWLSRAEIDALIAPSSASRNEISSWLLQNGIPNESIHLIGSDFAIYTSARHVERLFNTTLHIFHHHDHGDVISALGEVHVPARIANVVDTILGVHTFPLPASRHSVHYDLDQAEAIFSTIVQPDDHPVSFRKLLQGQMLIGINVPFTINMTYGLPLRTAYNPITDNTSPTMKTKIAVTEFGSSSNVQYFSNSDLESALSWLGYPSSRNLTIPDSRITGTNVPANAGSEGSMNIQIVTQLVPEADRYFWLQDNSFWVYGALRAVYNANDSSRPQVVSISWGITETDNNCGGECILYGLTTSTYLNMTNELFQQLGLMGVTIVVSSGNDGASGTSNPNCNYTNPSTAFNAPFPATSPYVLAVGATTFQTYSTDVNAGFVHPLCFTTSSTLDAAGQLYDSIFPTPFTFYCIREGSEVAVNFTNTGFSSGGGFSKIFRRPLYQSTFVNAYLNHSIVFPPSNYFNSSNRAFPDVAAIGTAWPVWVNGVINYVGGTSVATPVFASIISYLNELSLQYTNRTLGFINPLLYQMAADDPTTFNDITIGSNYCPRGASCPSQCTGYRASEGWDATTGIGTPNVARIRQYLITRVFPAILAFSSSSSSSSSTSSPISVSSAASSSSASSSISSSSGSLSSELSSVTSDSDPFASSPAMATSSVSGATTPIPSSPTLSSSVASTHSISPALSSISSDSTGLDSSSTVTPTSTTSSSSSRNSSSGSLSPTSSSTNQSMDYGSSTSDYFGGSSSTSLTSSNAGSTVTSSSPHQNMTNGTEDSDSGSKLSTSYIVVIAVCSTAAIVLIFFICFCFLTQDRNKAITIPSPSPVQPAPGAVSSPGMSHLTEDRPDLNTTAIELSSIHTS